MTHGIPSSPPALGSFPAYRYRAELTQKVLTGLNLEKQHAAECSGVPRT